MAQVFAKRFWGFDPKHWPIISFGLEGNRDALIKESHPGDLIAFIGTKTPSTEPNDRGRLLGLAEIGRIPIDSIDVLDISSLNSDNYASNGRLKWPKSLPMLRAWRFPDRPKVTSVLKRQLSYEATVRAVLLDEWSQTALLTLRMEQVDVPDLEIIQRHRALAAALSQARPTRGPKPSSWSGDVSRDASTAAVTYTMRFGTRNIWKIGHAQDMRARLADVNRHIPHETLNERWSEVWTQKWPTQEAAYEMEQRVLSLLTEKRTEGERVACTEVELERAWISAMIPTHHIKTT